MNRNKALFLYLLGTLGQIWIICIIVFMLRRSGLAVDYTTPLGMAAVGVGGISSALWGSVIAVKYKNYKVKKILKDFFYLKQNYRSYLLVIFFLCLDFLPVIVNGKFLISAWYVPIALFLKALIFGGIEEIGWRYVFQPVLQERYNYILSTLITFVVWGIWHFSYFYIEGSLPQVQGVEFLLGLLINCFILSSLFIKTKSLWICVMTHSLINVFSQLAVGGNPYISYICKIIIIVMAIIISSREQKINAEVCGVQMEKSRNRGLIARYGKVNIGIVVTCAIFLLINSIIVSETALNQIASNKYAAYLLNFLAGCEGKIGTIGSMSKAKVFIDGEWWRLILHMYLHAGVLHMLFNVFTLLSVGKVIEKKTGSLPYFLLYHAIAVVNAIIMCLIFPESISVGASAGIFGMIGIVCVMRWKKDIVSIENLKKSEIIYIILFAVLSLLLGVESFVTHLAAFVLGIFAGHCMIKVYK